MIERIPSNWTKVALLNLCNITTGSKDVNEGDKFGRYPFFTCAKDISYFNSYSFEGKAILIAGNGNFSVKKFDGKFEVYQRTYVLQNFSINYTYLYYFILHKLKDITKDNRGSTIRYIRIGNLTDYNIIVAPLNEQKRIVAKIEELFSELDNAILNLKTAKNQLKLYRQSVLKHAFEGKLTEKWREEHQDRLPSPETLLEEIKNEREKRYEEQLEKWKEEVEIWEKKGKKGKKPAKPKKLKEIQLISTEDITKLKKLPNKWFWNKLANFSEVSGGLTKNSKRNTLDLKVPFLRVANVYANELKLSEMHTIGINKNELDRVLLKKQDLLVVEGNGSANQIGRVAIWDGTIKNCVHQNHLIKARPSTLLNPKYALYYLLSFEGREMIKKVASSTSGLYTLNLTKVSNFTLPITFIQEQNQIVQEIESRLSIVEKLELTIDENLKKSESLRQSILKKAFEGKLVEQDINDESAKELLIKIRKGEV